MSRFLLFTVAFLSLGTASAEVLNCPNGAQRNGYGICPRLPGNGPPGFKMPTVGEFELTGFNTASIEIPQLALARILLGVEEFQSENDGVSLGDSEYYFDLLEVQGMYDGRRLTDLGRNKVFQEVRAAGMQHLVPDLNANGRTDPGDINDLLLGQLRVHALNNELSATRAIVRVALPERYEEIDTVRGPIVDDPALRGVQGRLVSTEISRDVQYE